MKKIRFIFIIVMMLGIFIVGDVFADSLSGKYTWDQLHSKFKAYTFDIELVGDVTQTSHDSAFWGFTVEENQTRTIDLNGYSLKLMAPLRIDVKGNNAVVNIIDSSANHTGKTNFGISIDNSDGEYSFTLNLNGGTYNGNKLGGFIYVPNVENNNVSINISNIKFSEINGLIEGKPESLKLKNIMANPMSWQDFTFKFINNDSPYRLNEIIEPGYKLVYGHSTVPLTEYSNTLNKLKSIYIAKDENLMSIDKFKDSVYGTYESQSLELTLSNTFSEEPLEITNVYMTDNTAFQLETENSFTIDYNQSIKLNVKTVEGLDEGIYNSNIIAIDSNHNIYTIPIKFEVLPKPVNKPTVASGLEFNYDGNNKSLSFDNLLDNVMIVSHADAVKVGKYTTIVSLKPNYCWEDNTKDTLNFNFEIKHSKIPKPVIISETSFPYNGSSYTPTVANYDLEKMQRTGNSSGNMIGNYTITYKLLDGYIWEDSSTEDVLLNWNIYRPVTLIEINGNDIVNLNKSYKYTALISPSSATYKDIKWSVNNGTGEATINQDGVLTANKVGTITIKATATDGSKIYAEKEITIMNITEIEKIMIKTNSIYVDTGTNVYLNSYIYPTTSTIKELIWTSSNTSIATVNSKTGGVSTTTKKGIVTIKATATDGSGVVGSIKLYVGYTNVKVGEIASLSSSSYVSYKEVEWEIEDPTIIESTGTTGYTGINQNYKHYIKVKALKNGSTTIIMKTISGTTLATSTVYVYTPISKISNDLNELELNKNETKKLNLTIEPNNVSEELNKLIYTSSDESVVKVDQNGNVTGLKNGKANIIIYSQYNNVSLTIPITVVTYTEKINLDTEILNFNEDNKTHQIIYEVLPEDASNKNIIFESSNPFVAKVSKTGLITATHNGTATITVKTEDGKQTKNIEVTVSGIEQDINSLDFETIEDLVYDGSPQTPEIIIYEDDYQLVKNLDYTISYDKNINAGLAEIKIEGIGNFKGTKTINFEIKKANIEYETSEITKIYDGNEYGINLNIKTPGVTVKYEDTDGNYTLASMPKYTNAGTYFIKYYLYADDNYNPVKGESKLIIKKLDISKMDVILSDDSYTWTGYAKKPTVTIEGLKEGDDFEVIYTNNTNVGTAKVSVIGIGNYEGEINKTFVIKAPVLPAPSSVKVKLYGHDDIKATWNKVAGASGYFVYIKKSTTSYWTYWGRTTGLSMDFSNRTDGTAYYVRVIPYKKIGEVRYKGNGKTSGYIYTLKKLNTPTVSKYSTNYVKIKWNNIYGESGYQIARKRYGTSTYYIVKNVSYKYSSTTLKTTRNKTYYYKVRAYKVVDGKKIYGPWSYVRAYKLR